MMDHNGFPCLWAVLDILRDQIGDAQFMLLLKHQNAHGSKLLRDRPETKNGVSFIRNAVFAIRQPIALREENASICGDEYRSTKLLFFCQLRKVGNGTRWEVGRTRF